MQKKKSTSQPQCEGRTIDDAVRWKRLLVTKLSKICCPKAQIINKQTHKECQHPWLAPSESWAPQFGIGGEAVVGAAKSTRLGMEASIQSLRAASYTFALHVNEAGTEEE